MKRKLYAKLLSWKKTSRGSSAALIDGARRVGKSYLAEEFARNAYASYILIDFGNVSKQVLALFENESDNLDLFFSSLSVFYRTKLVKRNSLIIFDEIQQYPRARQLIKYFVADGRYDFLETGSLISLKRNVRNIIIPSEEEYFFLYPMDFEEYLWARGDEVTMPFVADCFRNLKPLGQQIHQRIMREFRQYLLTGGMPAAVAAYAATKDFAAVDRIKKNILALYRADVSKFAKGYESKVLAIFDEIPAQLSKHDKRFHLASLKKDSRYRTYEDAFVWLSEAMITNLCLKVNDPNVGLALSSEENSLKCYMMDTGLLVTQIFADRDYLDNELYRKILFDKLGFNEVMIMENAVAQMLRTSGHTLYYYAQKENPSERPIEIDFLIAKNNKISPVEVKSSNYTNHVSLDRFMQKYRRRIGQSYILYTKDVQIKDGIVCLPLYMAMML